MEIPVLIERVANNGYRVSSSVPFPFAVEGTTRDEAIGKAHELIAKRATEGGEIASLSIGQSSSEQKSWAGYLGNDPRLAEWKRSMEDYRKKVDAEEGP